MSKKKHRKKHNQSFKKLSTPAVNEVAKADLITITSDTDTINANSEVKKILIIMGIMVIIVIVVAIVNNKTTAIIDLGEHLLKF